MTIYNLLKEILEILYYIASIGLFAGIIVALNQLKLMKSDIISKNKRASVEKSIEYLNWFAKDFIPQYNHYADRIASEEFMQYDYLELQDMDFVFNDSINMHNKEVSTSIDIKMDANALDLLNQLEFFSAAMMSGLADEKLAFNPLATPFCEFVEVNYDVYCYLKNIKGNRENMFSSTKDLYIMWKERSNEIDFKQKQEKSSKQLRKPIEIIGSK